MAASALMVLSCNTKSSSTSSNGEEQKVDRKLTTQVFTYENDDEHAQVKLSIEMPVGGDELLGNSVYDVITEFLTNDHDCSDDLDEYRNDGQELVELFGRWMNDDLQEQRNYYAEDTDDDATFSSSATFSIIECNEKYVTCLYETEYFNMADGFWEKNGVSLLMSDCSRITNDFLFKDPTSTELAKVLRDDMVSINGGAWEDPDLEDVESVMNDQDFYVTSEGLAYFFRRGLLYPQNIEGILTWDKVQDLLTDEAKKLR